MKRNFVQYLTVASLCVAPIFAAQARDFGDAIGSRRGVQIYQKRSRENAEDVAHRNNIQAGINQFSAELALIRPRYELAKQDYQGTESKLQAAAIALEKFRVDNVRQINASIQRRAELEQSSGALLRVKSLADLIEKLMALSSDGFLGELSLECRGKDLGDAFVVPAECPPYAEAADACEVYRSFFGLVDADLNQWKVMGLPIERVIDVSPALRTFTAVQRNSAMELEQLQGEIARQSRQLEAKLAALKADANRGRLIDGQLMNLEAAQRSALIEFDRAAAIFRAAASEFKSKEADVALRQREFSEFKVRIEEYSVLADSYSAP